MTTKPKSPDPLVLPQVPDGQRFNFEAHVRTNNGFLNLLKWFSIHMANLLVGLYFLIIAGDPYLGGFLIVLAIAALIYGLVRNPKIRQDAQAATAGGEIAD